jgi:hypothetical protein
MLENSEGAIQSGQSRETGNIGYTRWRQTKQIQNTICVGHHYAQTNTHNVNWACVPNVESVRDPWIVHSGLPLLFSLTFIINTKFTGDKGDFFLNKVNGYTRIYAKYFVTAYFTIDVIAWIRKSVWRFGLQLYKDQHNIYVSEYCPRAVTFGNWTSHIALLQKYFLR